MIDDHDRCEWVNVSSRTGSTGLSRTNPESRKTFVCVCMCACSFSGPLGLIWGFCRQNRKKDGVMLISTNSFLLLGCFTFVPILVKID